MSDHAPTPETPAPAPKRRRRWKRRLLAAGFGAGLALFAVELTVRILWSKIVLPSETALLDGLDLEAALAEETLRAPENELRPEKGNGPHRLYVYDPARGWRLIPSNETTDHVIDGQPERTYAITTDALSLRGPVRGDPEPGALKVLVVGDSMTFGKGVNDAETFPHQLEALLAEKLGRPVRVYNGGVSSYGQIEEAAALAELVPKLEPDLVLLAFTVANDLTDNLRWKEGVVPLERDPEAEQAFEHLVLDNPLAWWSRTYRLLAWRWGRHLLRYRLMSTEPLLDHGAELVARAHAAAGERPFGVVIVPPQFEVQGYWAEPLLNADEIHAGLTERLEALELPVHDPLTALQERASEELYIPGDLHFTATGHRAFAEAITEFVAELAPK